MKSTFYLFRVFILPSTPHGLETRFRKSSRQQRHCERITRIDHEPERYLAPLQSMNLLPPQQLFPLVDRCVLRREGSVYGEKF